jgi:RNA methyltransferase, TrmH family
LTNNELKYYAKLKQKKYRDSENKFLIEGPHLIEECLKSPRYNSQIEKVIKTNNFQDQELIEKISSSGFELISIEEKKFDLLADTKNPQGIVAVLNIPDKVTELENDLIIALDNINDPGNLGTILRTAYWFNFKDILIGNDSVEIYNSKVLRASQGAVFHLNIKDDSEIISDLNELYEKDYSIFLTTAGYDLTVSGINWKDINKAVIVFGNEASGIRKELLDNSGYKKIGIEKFSDCESLNVSISSGIVLNDIRKNR